MDQKELTEMKQRLHDLGFKDRPVTKPFHKQVLCAVGFHDWVKLYTITGQQMVEDGRACDICHKHEAY
jgi:hypothetical protein